jgi:hypothetical protein
MEREIEINGYTIHYTINWVQNGTDGIGQYEYWGSKYTDNGSPIWNIESVDILSANTPEDEEVDVDHPDSSYDVGTWIKEIIESEPEYLGEND